jgi:hypothetical protein
MHTQETTHTIAETMAENFYFDTMTEAELRQYIEDGPTRVNGQDKDGWTPLCGDTVLHLACEIEDEDDEALQRQINLGTSPLGWR